MSSMMPGDAPSRTRTTATGDSSALSAGLAPGTTAASTAEPGVLTSRASVPPEAARFGQRHQAGHGEHLAGERGVGTDALAGLHDGYHLDGVVVVARRGPAAASAERPEHDLDHQPAVGEDMLHGTDRLQLPRIGAQASGQLDAIPRASADGTSHSPPKRSSRRRLASRTTSPLASAIATRRSARGSFLAGVRGRTSTRPRRRASHSSATGHAAQDGARGTHTVAPASCRPGSSPRACRRAPRDPRRAAPPRPIREPDPHRALHVLPECKNPRQDPRHVAVDEGRPPAERDARHRPRRVARRRPAARAAPPPRPRKAPRRALFARTFAAAWSMRARR